MLMLLLAVVGTLFIVAVAWEAIVSLFILLASLVIGCAVVAAVFGALLWLCR